MLTATFDYELPSAAIAQYPTEQRDGARMLVVEPDRLTDDWVKEFCERVPEGSLVVVNDSRVRRARIFGKRRDSGGRIELLLLEPRQPTENTNDGELWNALGRPLRSLKPGVRIDADGFSIKVHERGLEGELVVAIRSLTGRDVEQELELHGHTPIPPYLDRGDDPQDAVRYQTVYANRCGSVAAPTAGLHLTERALGVLLSRGVEVGSVTLHVGVGTFRPVAVDDLDQHPMHQEWFEIGPDLAERIEALRKRNGRLIAVGTTAVRALESAADPNHTGFVRPRADRTRLLIQPGYRFRVVDGLLTNFHQPRSTLLALVAAAIGVERMRFAYDAAIRRGYRFLSYGDAMWIPELLG